MKTVLILGSNGFLGRACVEKFTSSGFEVYTADKVGAPNFLGDLSNNSFTASLPATDVLVNCAAVQYVSNDLPIFNRKKYFRKNNITTAKNLAARYSSCETHFIHIGTSMMYHQNGSLQYSIASQMRADGIYSETKLLAQSYINNLKKSSTIIPCIIGGVGREGLFRGFVNSLKKFNMAFFPGSGNQPISLVHVEDVASLALRIASIGALGQYNAAAFDALSIRQWVEVIADELSISRPVIVSLPLQPIELLSKLSQFRLLAPEQISMLRQPHVLNISESVAIGWRPVFSSDEVIRDIARHITETKV